jgi:hypothetical protein
MAVTGATSAVPVLGDEFAIVLATALNWEPNDRREEWFGGISDAVADLSDRVDGLDLDSDCGRDRPSRRHRRRVPPCGHEFDVLYGGGARTSARLLHGGRVVTSSATAKPPLRELCVVLQSSA